ncbi:unnamed protein product [Blepharisma stoltei]|uniref:Uncharacterized protein n=1 Tax=Blepharisma stoltei TaxID=1481888 RepID=A0AAU9IIS7_9CILI|nr:unnamed protein product [Blepharisma stoltei]
MYYKINNTMGCGIPHKGLKLRQSQEEGDTSLQDVCADNISPAVEIMINPTENHKFSYNIKGLAYKIVISDVKSPDQSLAFK